LGRGRRRAIILERVGALPSSSFLVRGRRSRKKTRRHVGPSKRDWLASSRVHRARGWSCLNLQFHPAVFPARQGEQFRAGAHPYIAIGKTGYFSRSTILAAAKIEPQNRRRRALTQWPGGEHPPFRAILAAAGGALLVKVMQKRIFSRPGTPSINSRLTTALPPRRLPDRIIWRRRTRKDLRVRCCAVPAPWAGGTASGICAARSPFLRIPQAPPARPRDHFLDAGRDRRNLP